MSAAYIDEGGLIHLPSGDVYDFDKDKLVGMKRILAITGTSRTTIERWMREGHFPQPQFRFGTGCNRWVERLLIEYFQKNGIGQPRS